MAKARWRFSDATTLTAAYVGNQLAFNLDGAQLQTLAATFTPSGTPVALNVATHCRRTSPSWRTSHCSRPSCATTR